VKEEGEKSEIEVTRRRKSLNESLMCFGAGSSGEQKRSKKNEKDQPEGRGKLLGGRRGVSSPTD